MNDSVRDPNVLGEPGKKEENIRLQAEEILEPESTSFLDKVVAFGGLILPFSWLLVWIRDRLESHVSKSVNNIVFLVGIVAFLFLVGKAAEKIRDYRKARNESEGHYHQ